MSRSDYRQRMYGGSDDFLSSADLSGLERTARFQRAATEYVFNPGPMENIMGGFDQTKVRPGDRVRIAERPEVGGSPPKSSGLVYIESAETGEFIGMVNKNSLEVVAGTSIQRTAQDNPLGLHKDITPYELAQNIAGYIAGMGPQSFEDLKRVTHPRAWGWESVTIEEHPGQPGQILEQALTIGENEGMFDVSGGPNPNSIVISRKKRGQWVLQDPSNPDRYHSDEEAEGRPYGFSPKGVPLDQAQQFSDEDKAWVEQNMGHPYTWKRLDEVQGRQKQASSEDYKNGYDWISSLPELDASAIWDELQTTVQPMTWLKETHPDVEHVGDFYNGIRDFMTGVPRQAGKKTAHHQEAAEEVMRLWTTDQWTGSYDSLVENVAGQYGIEVGELMNFIGGGGGVGGDVPYQEFQQSKQASMSEGDRVELVEDYLGLPAGSQGTVDWADSNGVHVTMDTGGATPGSSVDNYTIHVGPEKLRTQAQFDMPLHGPGGEDFDLEPSEHLTEDTQMRQTVMNYMGPGEGSPGAFLSPDEYTQLYLMADGFGTIDQQFAEQNSYDWSHVRDSSPEAIRRIYDQLRQMGKVSAKTADQAWEDAWTLSSGTMATLIGANDYETITKVQQAFANWVQENEGRFSSWQEAWNEWGPQQGYGESSGGEDYQVEHFRQGQQDSYPGRDKARSHKNETCKNCGAKSDLQVHHKDGDRRNNGPANIETLCQKCHTKGHWNKGTGPATDSVSKTNKTGKVAQDDDELTTIIPAGPEEQGYRIPPPPEGWEHGDMGGFVGDYVDDKGNPISPAEYYQEKYAAQDWEMAPDLNDPPPAQAPVILDAPDTGDSGNSTSSGDTDDSPDTDDSGADNGMIEESGVGGNWTQHTTLWSAKEAQDDSGFEPQPQVGDTVLTPEGWTGTVVEVDGPTITVSGPDGAGKFHAGELEKASSRKHAQMDEWTQNHFNEWLTTEIPVEEQDSTRELMLKEYAEDPEYYNQEGWWRLYDNVHGRGHLWRDGRNQAQKTAYEFDEEKCTRDEQGRFLTNDNPMPGESEKESALVPLFE